MKEKIAIQLIEGRSTTTEYVLGRIIKGKWKVITEDDLSLGELQELNRMLLGMSLKIYHKLFFEAYGKCPVCRVKKKS